MSSSKKWHSLGDFLKAKEEKEKESETPTTPVTDVTPVRTVTPVTGEAAPRRDFTRVANSVVRDAIPAGVFTGKGKQLYDYLYSHTRGAIVPTHSARIPTERVMKGAGMTRHTYRAHIQRLISFGLVKVEERPGEHGGNFYTVFLPEEVSSQRSDPGHRGDRGYTSDTGDKVPVVQGSQIHPSDRGLNADDSTASERPKTSFKTNTERSDDDDAALAVLRTTLEQVSREITGKGLSPAERERWGEVAVVLATELKIAAARTTVSSVPSFLAEHLRRRLWKKDKKQLEVEEVEAAAAETSAAAPQIDASNCPDCGGSGWYYPGERERGIAKCAHKRLTAQNEMGSE